MFCSHGFAGFQILFLEACCEDHVFGHAGSCRKDLVRAPHFSNRLSRTRFGALNFGVP